MWMPRLLYLILKRPLTVVGLHIVRSPVPAGPISMFSPLFRSISVASWKEAESMPSVSGIGFGDFLMGNGVGTTISKFAVAVGLASLITRFVTAGAVKPAATATTL